MQKQNNSRKQAVKNNGNNGHVDVRLANRKTIFQLLHIREDVALAFKNNARMRNMDYSEYLRELMDGDFVESLLKDSPYANSLQNILAHLAKKAAEPSMRDYGLMEK